MGFRTNTTNRLAERNAIDEVEIFSLSDFPAPVAGVITLEVAKKYTIKAPINLGTNIFSLGSGGDVIFQGINNKFNSITYEGTGTLFTSTTPDIVRMIVLEMTFISTGTGATLFDLTSVGGTGTSLFNRSTAYVGGC